MIHVPQVAGALGSFVGNPADLALLRMQADGSLPLEQRRHYRYIQFLLVGDFKLLATAEMKGFRFVVLGFLQVFGRACNTTIFCLGKSGL